MERRRALRQLNIWQRGEGLNILRVVEGRKSSCVSSFALLCTAIEDPDLSRILIYVVYAARYVHCVFGPRIMIPPLVRVHRIIKPYLPAEFRVLYRFEKRHVHALMDCLGFTQDDIVCDNGAHCNSEEAFLYCLFE